MQDGLDRIPYIQLLACAEMGRLRPWISAVVHAADFAERLLAPGQLATVFESLGPVDGVVRRSMSRGLVSTDRGGVRVLFDEVEAPLFFARNDQVNVQVPLRSGG
ncbi:MAG: hypothetical protein R2748_23330 [Bryobacterales bacterium]